jgi:hypothetical protein
MTVVNLHIMKPIRQQWAKFGGIICVSIIGILLFSETNWSGIEVLFQLHLCIFLLHQFEEYVFPGGFKTFFNTNIYGKTAIMQSPLTDTGILIVNVLIGWSAYGASAWHGTSMLWLAIGLALITITNGIMHTAIAIFQSKYNPGVVTGSVLFIPFGIYFLDRLLPLATASDVTGGVIVFIIGTMSIPAGVYLSSKLFPDKN